jgi:iron(III) transport system permease protein
MTSMASFSAPLLFGGEFRVLSVHLYSTRLSGDLPLAAVQTVVMSGVSIAFLIGLRFWNDRSRTTMATKGARPTRKLLPLGRTRLLLPPMAVGFSACLLLPHLTLVLLSVVEPGTWTFRADTWMPTRFTFENYRYVLSLARPLWHSVQMALFATLANVVFGVMIGWLLAVRRIRFSKAIDAVVMLPWALPGTVVAVNLLSAFNTRTFFGFGKVLAGSIWLLPLAYFIRNLPLVARSAQSAFAQLDRSLDEAARSLGAGWWLRFRKVTFPIIAPGVIGGSALAFVTALGEFVASVLLWVPANQPLSMAIFGEYREYHLEAAAAYGVILVAFIGVVLVASRAAFGNKAVGAV